MQKLKRMGTYVRKYSSNDSWIAQDSFLSFHGFPQWVHSENKSVMAQPQ